MPHMYILECDNGKYYTGSTKNLQRRLAQHFRGEGANFTRKHKPVRLVYIEEFSQVQDAYYREKQIQGWSHGKKTALIVKNYESLHTLAECHNGTHYHVYQTSALGSARASAEKDAGFESERCSSQKTDPTL